ncbi:MAG: LysM peptidoglycan-binding domain-containing protein [Clostridia bacterium]
MFSYISSPQCPKGATPHVIQAGDTLGKIARQYNTTVQAIISVNQGINPYTLRIGQQICIPTVQQEYPSCPTTNYYVVKAGDTLESIAGYFNITVENLLQSNLGIEPEDLYQDMYLCIPIVPPPVNIGVNTGAKILIVYRGDRIFKTYPVAVGRASTPTPKGTYAVLYKEVTPEEIFGLRLIGLSIPDCTIHGTSNVGLIGTESTEGDIILVNDNIDELFNLTPVETIVRIF